MGGISGAVKDRYEYLYIVFQRGKNARKTSKITAFWLLIVTSVDFQQWQSLVSQDKGVFVCVCFSPCQLKTVHRKNGNKIRSPGIRQPYSFAEKLFSITPNQPPVFLFPEQGFSAGFIVLPGNFVELVQQNQLFT